MIMVSWWEKLHRGGGSGDTQAEIKASQEKLIRCVRHEERVKTRVDNLNRARSCNPNGMYVENSAAA